MLFSILQITMNVIIMDYYLKKPKLHRERGTMRFGQNKLHELTIMINLGIIFGMINLGIIFGVYIVIFGYIPHFNIRGKP